MFERIFGQGNYIPTSIKNEFIKRWAKIEKLNFREFFLSIRNNADSKWWNSPAMIDQCYNSYVMGYINTRYPRIPVHPGKVLNEIIKDADKMINF